MFELKDREATSETIKLPIAGKLLRAIRNFPNASTVDNQSNISIPTGSFVLFLLSEKVHVKFANLDFWIFHFLLDGEKIIIRWYDELPIPNTDAKQWKQNPFDWQDYFEYVYPE